MRPAVRTITGRVSLTWLATRLVALASIALTHRLLDDVWIYEGWLRTLTNRDFPLYDPKWQYPPGAGALLLAPSALGARYGIAFVSLMVLIDATVMALLIGARLRSPGTSWRGPWLWAAAALVVGPIMFTRFDVVPTLVAVTAILSVSRPARSGALAALGMFVKVWPALLILVLPRPSLRRGLTSFLITTGALLAGFLIVFQNAFSFLHNQQARGLQVESVGAIPWLLSKATGHVVDIRLEYGSMQVHMAGAEAVGTAVTVLGVVLIAVIATWRLTGKLESIPAGDVGVAVVLVSVASSRVYSPQFNTWIIGVLAAALLASGSAMRRPAIILIAVSMLTQLVYPWNPSALVDGNPLIVVVQFARVSGLLAATIMAVWAISPARTRKRSERSVTSRAPSAQRPERDSRGGGDIQGVDATVHGDAHNDIRLLQDASR